MRVIGTAGHVDHGKSTLVRTLTGIDPDRLAEEKVREMTIDLGFAWMTTPNGETLGFVDVPGHRDFIENMLAGVGGIDAVLLVIAADEGVMPQTREHLAILDILGIQQGLVVLTKVDTVSDPDWLELVKQDIQGLLTGTSLAGIAIVPVSARTRFGLGELVQQLEQILAAMPARVAQGFPRLPIDRIFSISGFGTVITGTLLDSVLQVGDEVEILPGGHRGRIRGLESYKQHIELAEPGSRVAVNLAGVDRDVLQRGMVLTVPDKLQPTHLFDARLRYLSDADRPLLHNTEVKVFAGTAEALGYVRLLADETILPGAETWVQIRLQTPMVLKQGDRFVLRLPSPAQTMGGGLVVNPHPQTRWRRFDPEVIRALDLRLMGTPEERLVQLAASQLIVTARWLQQQMALSASEVGTLIQDTLHGNELITLADDQYMAAGVYNTLILRMQQLLAHFHQQYPLRLGMDREELRSRLGLTGAQLTVVLQSQQAIRTEQSIVRLAEHQITFSAAQRQAIEVLWSQFQAAPYTPPSFTEASQVVGEDVLYALLDLGQLVRIQPDVLLSVEVYQTMVSWVFATIDSSGGVAANQLRDQFSTTRKYAIGLLEHLDALNLTKRNGDNRVRGSRRL
jgi:selenocysteine-specific elongation factor